MQYLDELIGAALIAAILTAVSATIARRNGVVSRPRSDRWGHAREIPRLSGPAVFVALIPWLSFEMLAVLGAFCFIGVRDDLRPLAPLAKALLLLVPCLAAGWLFGEPWIALACWVSANAFNMLDHADGTAGSTCIGSLAVAGGEVGMCGAGAALGFFAYNWPPARVFLGDGGSLMLGALLPLAWYPHGILPTLAGLSVPLIDSAFVVTSRLMKGQAPWVGGTDHTGHRLLRAGVPPRWLPVIYGGASGSIALMGKTYL